MKKQSIAEIDKYIADYNITHFKKVNFFGRSKVGKKTLISYINHFSDKDVDFIIKKEEDNEEENEIEENNSSLVEEIKKITIKYKQEKRLDINLYITNIDDTELISNNLDTLLSNSECAIFMIDITSTDSFTQISELIPKIYEIMKSNIEYGEVPMFFISNKIDLELKREVSGFEVKELVDHYAGMKSYEISLNLPKNENDETINEFLLKLYSTISEKEKQYTFKHDSLNLVRICEPIRVLKESKLMKSVENTINLLLLGSTTVGKTSFAQKVFSNQFKEETITTLGIDIETTVVELYGCLVKIELWDTVGQERLRSLPQKYYSKGDGFFLLFDVTDRKSFEDISGWIKDIRKARGNANEDNIQKKSDDEVLVLIGNKIDLIQKREVTKEEAKELAQQFNVKYYETSCKQGINLYEILCDIIINASSNNRRESTANIMLQRKDQAKNVDGKKKKCC